VLTCYRTRRQIGAYLDRALPEPAARSAAVHVEHCPRCRRELGELERLRSLVRGLPQPRDPDWTGFWQGVVRGVEDSRLRGRAAIPARRWRWHPRFAFGGVLAAILLATLTFWQVGNNVFRPHGSVIIGSADTDNPDSTVMVYSTPEHDMAVVWVFESD
jgi:anti-sigma factor RsiW